MPAYTRRLHILISEEQFDLLELLSQRQGCSVAELVRQAIDNALQPRSSIQELQALKKLPQFSALSAEKWEQLAEKLKLA